MNAGGRLREPNKKPEPSTQDKRPYLPQATAGNEPAPWGMLQRFIGNRAVGLLLEAQRQASSEGEVSVSSEQQSLIDAELGQGRPLDEDMGPDLQPVMGGEGSGIRLHEGAMPAALAAGLGAKAFTQGRDIFIGAGYRGGTPAGDQTLAHEVTHAVAGRTNAGAVQREVATTTEIPASTPATANAVEGTATGAAVPEATDAPAVKHYSLSSDVVVPTDIEDKVSKMADAYYLAKKADLVITDGERTTAQQAEYIYRKLESDGESDTGALYSNGQNIKEIIAAWKSKKTKEEQVQAMTEALDKQVDAGTYISQHLRNNAVDVRSSDGTNMAELKKAAESNGGTLLDESKKKAGPHYHIGF